MAVEIRLGGMSIRSLRLSPLVAVAVLLAGCAAPPPSGESASASPAGTASGSSGPADGPSPTAASIPQAIPDLLDPIEHDSGDIVELPGLTFSYQGLEALGDQLRARFQVVSGAATGAMRLLLPDGSVVPVQAVDDELVSDPFGSAAAPPLKTSVIALGVNGILVPFVTGSPR